MVDKSTQTHEKEKEKNRKRRGTPLLRDITEVYDRPILVDAALEKKKSSWIILQKLCDIAEGGVNLLRN